MQMVTGRQTTLASFTVILRLKERVNPKFVSEKLQKSVVLLTSTLMPVNGKILAGGFSNGEYR